MTSKVAFDCLYIAVGLAVDVNFNAAEVKMLEVKGIVSIRAVERRVVDHSDDYSARNLSREKSFVNVIAHAVSDGVAFADHASNGIFCVAHLKCFCLCNKDAGRDVRFSYQQLAFMYFNAKS